MSLGGIKYNVIISQGSHIIISRGVPDNYAFTYIDFSKTQVNTFQEDVTDSKYAGNAGNNFLELRYIMNGKNQMIIMHKIKDLDVPICSNAGFISGVAGNQISLTNNSLTPINVGLQENYKNLPTGIVSPAGTIIPQPMVPSDDFVGYDNGVYIDKQLSERPFTSYGYVWSAVQMSAVNGAASGVTQAVKSVRLYGIHQDLGYVSNEQARHALIDFPVIANRKYKCNVGRSSSGKGSCVICYKFCSYNIVGQGGDNTQKNKIPFIHVLLDAVVSSIDSTMTSANQHKISGGLQLLIPPDHQITVVVNKYKNQGALSTPSAELLPPQSKFVQGQGLTTIPLFIYPLYTGLVVTNSIIKSSQKNSSDNIFVKIPTVLDPRNAVEILNVQPSPQIVKDMEGDADFKFKWFPALFQGTASNSRKNIKLTVKPKQHIEFDDNVQIVFQKAAGSFAYCPLYFNRILQFTLLFKGQYVRNKSQNSASDGFPLTPIQSNFRYYLYPLVYQIPDEASKQYRDDGCVVVKYDSGASNGLICQDDYLQQAIYRATFRFSSMQLPRYPLQVFGAVVVLHRPTSPFPVSRANGRFEFCKGNERRGDFSSQFINIKKYGKQNSKLNFYQLITNCKIQCALQGVSGNLTLDAYPLNQQISTLMQTQSIGQIDLDIQFLNDSGGICKDNSNPNPSIFKGFGMEISTNNQQNNYSIGVNLAGIQRKIQDMKLVCAPFWDGDRLEAICAYFQEYLNVNFKMVNYKCNDIKKALPISSFSVVDAKGTWKSNKKIAIGDEYNISSPDFRVARSFNWEAPHINFQTGTSCMQALNKLAQNTSCVFVVGLDGTGYFYELNDYGFPYYVTNQEKFGGKNIVEIALSDISSISLSPSIVNKYNSIATMGFIAKKKNGTIDQDSIAASTQPGINYTNIKADSRYAGKTLFPWTRHNVGMESGYLTRTQLLNMHRNRILFSISDVYTGNITVRGNTKVNHVYQLIKVNGICFFVQAIDHDIDLQSKKWITTYTITYQNIVK